MTIKLENHKGDIPAIEYTYYEKKKVFRLHYGVSRGWREFDTEIEALVALDEHLDMRMHSVIRELDALAALKRKTAKRIEP